MSTTAKRLLAGVLVLVVLLGIAFLLLLTQSKQYTFQGELCREGCAPVPAYCSLRVNPLRLRLFRKVKGSLYLGNSQDIPIADFRELTGTVMPYGLTDGLNLAGAIGYDYAKKETGFLYLEFSPDLSQLRIFGNSAGWEFQAG